MATVTPNFNWPVPTSTDLVKDGATAIEALGDSIDASLVDLKGGTTGQVLSKTSGTDMDFTWVTSDDSNAIQNTIVDAKGDLIGATAADTPARLAVGTNGQVLTADSTAATGLAWSTVSSGGFTTIATGSLSGSSVSLSSIPSTYTNLQLDIYNMTSSVTSAISLTVNGVTSNYGNSLYFHQNGTAGNNGNASDSAWGFSPNSSWDETSTANRLILTIFDYSVAAQVCLAHADINYLYDNGTTRFTGSAALANHGLNAAVNQINIISASGTFSGGTYILRGLK